jgi:hypothetical protein
MKLIKRDPNLGYIDSMLWVPKSLINVDGVKHALEFELPERSMIRVLQLWGEAEHHLIVPRAFWKPEDLGFQCIDCRPEYFPKADIKSNICLDMKPGPGGLLQQTGNDLQKRAIDALLKSTGGTLQLACISGDTILNLNRAGKGFKMSIREAFKRVHSRHARYSWDIGIPTYVRAHQGERIGLQRVRNIIYKGKRKTYRLKLEDGKELRLTREHEVLTTQGFLSLKDGLKPGHYIMVDGGRGKSSDSIHLQKTVYKRLNWYPCHPFAHKNGNKKGPLRGRKQVYVLEEHRAVAEAALNHLSLAQYRSRCRIGDTRGLVFIDPAKFHVHHKDENCKNNAPDNLEILLVEEHLSRHRPGANAFGYGIPTPVRLVSVAEYAVEDVYDLVCADPHRNFVANGIVIHNCGKGKTVVALHLASILKVPTIIAVDNTHLLRQWQEEIAKHLVVPSGVGLIQGQIRDWNKDIVMTTYQTLARWADTMPEYIRRRFGLVIWDEGHHVNAPTFSKSAPLFYGYRLALTATPDRLDGSHVICQHHVGDIIFKDVIQECPPSITFKWTGYKLDLEDEEIKKAVCDKNSEIHLGKIASHFGSNRSRMVDIVLPEVERLVAMKHKVLVLSYSVDEVINLMTLWTRQDPNTPLYSEIPYPAPAEVGETVTPVELKPAAAKRLESTIAEIRRNLGRQNLPAAKRTAFEERLKNYTLLVHQFEVWKKTEKLYRQRQRQFIHELLSAPSSSGLFTEAVKPEDRFKMLRERQVIFAIMKYGKEGLDDKKLSAIVVSEPMSDRNTLQQIMGRPRNKSNSELVFLEDDISPLIGQCRKLRRHLRDWPIEEGGPFRYNLVGHPATLRRQGATTWNQLSQQTTSRWNPAAVRHAGLRSPAVPTNTLR